MNKIRVIVAFSFLAAVAYLGFHFYTGTDTYKAKQAYERGLIAFADNKPLEALEFFKEAYVSHTSISSDARKSIANIINTAYLENFDPSTVAQLLTSVTSVRSTAPAYQTAVTNFYNKYKIESPYEAGQLAILASRLMENEEKSTLEKEAHALLINFIESLHTNQSLAEEVSLLDEKFNDCLFCEKVLAPFANDLGDSEAARALGQFYARSGESEKAFTLLSPYTKSRLAEYKKAEQEYNATLDKIWQSTIDFLDKGKAPESFYTEYNQGDEQRKSELVNEVYSHNIDKSTELNKTRKSLQDKSVIVPVALDLAIVRLTRATAMQNPEHQRKELMEAESIFLAVQSYAGDSDEYQLYLGQVYYWLGKQNEGDKLFTALIDKYNRSDSVLYSLSQILRELGARTKATEYIEEAYEKASDQQSKQGYAYQRYLLASTIEEQITWLERSDQSQMYVQADLFTAKASKAVSDNDREMADRWYQKSIDLYLSLPERSSNYNNVALIYMSKYQNGGNEEDYTKALENMDLAVELSPDDSIVLSNAVDFYAVRTYRSVLDEVMDLSVIHSRASLDLLGYLYSTGAEKKALVEKLSKSKSYKKLIDYTKRSTVLSPKDASIFSNAYATYEFVRMDQDLINLANRLDRINLEINSDPAAITSYRSGENDEQNIIDINQAIKEFKGAYKELDRKKYPLESVVIDTALIKYQLSLLDYGVSFDFATIEKIAKQNYINFKSSKTRQLYLDVLMQKAISEARQLDPVFDAFYKQYFRVLGSEEVFAIALKTQPGLKEKIVKLDAVKSSLNLITESRSAFPERPNMHDWFMLSAFDQELAATIKESFQGYVLRDTYSRIASSISTNKESVTLTQFINHKIMDRDAQAQAVITQALAENQLLPEGLLEL